MSGLGFVAKPGRNIGYRSDGGIIEASLKTYGTECCKPVRNTDAEAKLTEFLTKSPKVKMDDGTEEEHKAVKGDAAQVKNMVQWILSQ